MTNRTLYSLGRVGISLAAVGMATPVLLAQTITTEVHTRITRNPRSQLGFRGFRFAGTAYATSIPMSSNALVCSGVGLVVRV